MISPYAKFDKQHWRRERIREHTPDYVYALRQISDRSKNGPIVINQDSTYQYIQAIHNHHTQRKTTKSGHKGGTMQHVIKIHGWSCADGSPILALPTRSDGNHDDGTIARCCLDKKYMFLCDQYDQDPTMRNMPGPTDGSQDDLQIKYIQIARKLKNCLLWNDHPNIKKQMVYLQRLIHLQDHLVSDNGYRGRNILWKRPAVLIKAGYDEQRLTMILAAWRRSCSAIRQVMYIYIECFCIIW